MYASNAVPYLPSLTASEKRSRSLAMKLLRKSIPSPVANSRFFDTWTLLTLMPPGFRTFSAPRKSLTRVMGAARHETRCISDYGG